MFLKNVPKFGTNLSHKKWLNQAVYRHFLTQKNYKNSYIYNIKKLAKKMTTIFVYNMYTLFNKRIINIIIFYYRQKKIKPIKEKNNF